MAMGRLHSPCACCRLAMWQSCDDLHGRWRKQAVCSLLSSSLFFSLLLSSEAARLLSSDAGRLLSSHLSCPPSHMCICLAPSCAGGGRGSGGGGGGGGGAKPYPLQKVDPPKMPADEEMVEDDEEEERGKGASIATAAQRPAGAKVSPATTPSRHLTSSSHRHLTFPSSPPPLSQPTTSCLFCLFC